LGKLTARLKTQGVLASLLVRELESSKYEVVARARRLRAAIFAELDSVPVRVVKLIDTEAMRLFLLLFLSADSSRPHAEDSRSHRVSRASPPGKEVLDNDSFYWYKVYHDITYNIQSPR